MGKYNWGNFHRKDNKIYFDLIEHYDFLVADSIRELEEAD